MALSDSYTAARSALEAILADVPEQPCDLARAWVTASLRPLTEARCLWDEAGLSSIPGPLFESVRAKAPEEALTSFRNHCDGAWERLGETERRALGQVYTPPEVVDTILSDVGYTGDEQARLIDPACGSGAFLAQAAARIAGAELDARQAAVRILFEVTGIEIRDEICGLARLRLGLEVVRLLASAGALRELADLPAPGVICADALDSGLFAMDRRRLRTGGFRWVVGNPPYLEAKRADEADKARWRERFAGRVEGAFDQYVCFLELALELAAPDGDIGMIIPNKFMVNRYARSLRRRLLQDRPPRTLRDLSHLPVFRNTGVYPIILHLGPTVETVPQADETVKTVPQASETVKTVPQADETVKTVPQAKQAVCRTVGPDGASTAMLLSAFGATGQAATFFIPADPVLGRLLARLLGSDTPRLGHHLRFRSTVSFHIKGLREQYVSHGIEPGKLPYLGGKSWMRRKEIAPFQVDWDGYGIRYASGELASVGNPLPPVDLFQNPKIVFCQHARRIMAYWDCPGRFVTKDVYPVALAPEGTPDPIAHTAAWAALLNSRLLTVLYGVLFRGISIGGGYYHYLPAFLEQVPCPAPWASRMAALAAITLAAQAGTPDLDALESLACGLFDLSAAERDAVDRAFISWASNDDPITEKQLADASPFVLK